MYAIVKYFSNYLCFQLLWQKKMLPCVTYFIAMFKIILYVYIILLASKPVQGQTLFVDTLKLCDNFVRDYKSTSIIGKDTLSVSRITKPDTILNLFLLNCAKRKDFRPVKFAFVVIDKQSTEYAISYKSDYIINDGEYIDNGIVAIVLAFIKYYESSEDGEVIFFTNDICKLMIKYRRKIPDYRYIQKHIK